jgi:magnesium chelatase subunit I
VSGAEFILEGLYAHKKIGRSEERTFTAGEKQPVREKPRRIEDDEVPDLRRNRRPFN